ncbi:MAG TPA: glycerol-3-phosphate 1-O-acyltransferase PlsB [Gammaproteobacteria bacterium]|jgi:glycerol-3-phosphate O-acyltransferase
MTANASGQGLRSAADRLRKLSQRVALVLVRYKVRCSSDRPPEGAVCYVLERDQLFDRLILQDHCSRERWPSPSQTLPDDAAALWSLRQTKGWFTRRLVPSKRKRLESLLSYVAAHPDQDIQLVPVAVFWGRSPAKERSWLKLLLAEDWAASGRIRRFFSILVHARQVLIKVSEPVSLKRLAGEDLGVERTTRKAARLLRVHFRRQRTATIGPDLSHRRLLLDEVLASPAVTRALKREIVSGHRSEWRVQRRARRIAREIAAHYSFAVVRVLEHVFTWLWNRLYEGVDVRHIERLDDIAVGAEVIYVPCHRSHIDYMLLSYVIYRRGLVPPHVAAGNNLDLPLIGRIVRSGGGFFMRRSFRGDALYSAVFRSYLRAIISRGFPLKFFIEGTRSRTGRLLAPKLGLLAMTVESFLLDRRRPIVYVPVYFGYEKLVEGQAFLGELRGRPKRRESLGGAIRSLRALRERFGSVYVSFGEPIWLEDMLDRSHARWREEKLEDFFKPTWIETVVERLGLQIMTAINDAAVVNPVNLVALVLLGMPKRAIVEVELRDQLELYLDLVALAPYSTRVGVTDLDAAQIVKRCEDLLWLQRRPHPLGDVLYMDERRAVLASYYRNNIVHLFALPSLVAASLSDRSELTASELTAQLKRLYPCLKAELFLRCGTAELEFEIERVVGVMARLGLLMRGGPVIRRPVEGTAAAAQFRLCAEIVQPFMEHYFLSVIFLLEHGSGCLTKTEAVRISSDAAEQLAMIYTLNSPDLFEAGLFANLIDALLIHGMLMEDSNGRLCFGESLAVLADALGRVLRPRVRQTLLNFARAATTTPSGAPARSSAPLERLEERL